MGHEDCYAIEDWGELNDPRCEAAGLCQSNVDSHQRPIACLNLLSANKSLRRRRRCAALSLGNHVEAKLWLLSMISTNRRERVSSGETVYNQVPLKHTDSTHTD
jgi:hypothetical protein